MGTDLEKIISEALALPLASRAFVAEKLIESLDAPECPPLSTKWQEEIERRCAETDRGAVELREAEAVFARAFARTG